MTTTPAPARPPFFQRDGVRRVIRTFAIAFLGLLIPGLLGWLNDLTAWAAAEGQTPFPDARSLAYVGVTAIVAGFIAALNAAVIVLEDLLGAGVLRTPGTAGQHRSEVGAADTRTLAIVALVVAGVVLLILLL